MSLSEIIIQRIREEGPISFHDFMEMSLYFPELGYYSSSKNKIGKDGDYYTSPDLTPVFGEMIAKQFEEMWELLGKQQFTILEYGAGTGALCRDILNHLKNNNEFYDKLNYCIIEKSPVMREKEFSNLSMNEKVKWCNSIQDIPEINGCVLSNEVLDNFSVHVVVMEEELMEIYVDYQNDFIEILKPASKEVKDYFSELNVILPKGFRTEVNLEAIAWIKEIAASLEKGFVITIDYGYPSRELYSDQRREGTLVCYAGHKVSDNLYSNIGEQDITTHVNFSALQHWGSKYELEYCGFTDQYHFLHALGITGHLRNMEQKPGALTSDLLQQVSLLLNDMGHKFKVLIQQKGLQKPMLSGMVFSERWI